MALARARDWLEVPDGHPFGLQTLPYGSFSDAHHPAATRVGVAIGDRVLNLTTAAERLLPGRADDFAAGNLDRFLAAGDGAWAQVRTELTEWLSHDHYRSAVEDLLVPASSVTMHLPFSVADYVDFYASRAARDQRRADLPPGRRGAHAELAPPADRLPRPGRHGRGVRHPDPPPVRPDPAVWFRGARLRCVPQLDFEAELGFVVGAESTLGEPVPASRFAEHVFGVCLVNDWSARDIQGWESVPLGPFLGKSFATTISPWIVPLAALEHARVRPPSRDTELASYLARGRRTGDWTSSSRYGSTATSCRARRTRLCTGARLRCSRT